ncbi:SMI1/KNR4 family protein [Nocardia rosealba]|uniref:SMI1/KNR4 family protein n=1 Tax=Nocardia rosealba TaxID=2878563 RepID=UPI001CD93A84|nr:SMI1/KNR4 family protein [Nocardia rosealba]MCA2208805.1 SMI1/KNR4 family protein [Nocardia rosealba]
MSGELTADAVVEEWKSRLIALARTPEYVFVDTPQELIDRHRARLTTFEGCTDAELEAVEKRIGGRFPEVFRQYLLQMGEACGDLFRGSDRGGIRCFDRLCDDAREIVEDVGGRWTLPPDAAIVLTHQGYTFDYVRAVGGFDGPVLRWTDGSPDEDIQIAATFAHYVDAQLRLSERNNRTARERGGYCLVLYPGGGQRFYSARNSARTFSAAENQR